MAFRASCRPERLRMAITARRAAMVDPAPTLVCNAGVPTVVDCIPIVGGVAAGTVQAEHPGMEDRVAVTARAIGG